MTTLTPAQGAGKKTLTPAQGAGKKTLTCAALSVAVLMMTFDLWAVEATQMDPSKTTYGERNPGAPKELEEFSFLVGKWQGEGKVKLDAGKVAEFQVSWISRYILDGTAIADEMHSVGPDGRPFMGITLRQYDASRKTWIVEFLNVKHSFLRKQVNGGSGSVAVDGRNVTVASQSPEMSIREHYLVADHDNWVYRMDVSTDGGRSWNEGQQEITFRRLE
jgi:hypothetical protein